MLHALTGTHIRPQGSVWLQSHTWPVPLLQLPLPDFHLLFTVQVPCEGRILLPQVVTSIRGSQINISYDLSSLQEPDIGRGMEDKGGGWGPPATCVVGSIHSISLHSKLCFAVRWHALPHGSM